jgi:RimJ/RimL family protein N-acetyltransferase
MEYCITTPRLGLRNWQSADEEPFIEMCRDPEVMKYFPALSTPEETRTLIDRLTKHFNEHRFTYFAVDRLDTSEFIGFTGLLNQTWESEFTPCVDMGWRLKRAAWGKGYATEAAQAAMDAGFTTFGLKEIFAFAAKGNTASEQVMQKLGMSFQGNFVHPKVKNDPNIPYCFAYKKIKPE